jgi:hypothetical protein
VKKSVIAVSIFFGLSCAALPLMAQTIKKWVDEDGVTHYSDQKPVAGETDVEEIKVPEGGFTTIDTEDAKQRIQKQLQRLEQDRKARQQEAAEKEEEKALEEAQERAPLVVEEKKKKKKKSRSDPGGPYPRPPPGPFPVPYPRL